MHEDLTVLVDGDKMARVFNNIMKNAVAYSYERLTTIAIEARRQMTAACACALLAPMVSPIPAAKAQGDL